MRTDTYLFMEAEGSILTEESSFYISERSTELALIFRLLSGSCVIANNNTEDSICLGRNYFFWDLRENKSGGMDFLDDIDESLALNDYENYLTKVGFRNRKFYRQFLNEIAGAIYMEEKGMHTASFVHIYRAYEHMSYAFPMIYAAKTENYIGTFENLRKWLTNSSSDGNVGELKFHKSFIAELFKGCPELSSTIDINICAKEEYKDLIFLGLAVKVLGWDKVDKYTAATSRPDKISIQFNEFHSFLVNLRNRFFHYSNARKDNIGLEDIIEPELLFSFVNKSAISYIATIFHGVTKHQM